MQSCPKCGLSLDGDAVFCPTCGWTKAAAMTTQGVPMDPPTASEAPGRSTTRIWIYALSSVVLVLWFAAGDVAFPHYHHTYDMVLDKPGMVQLFHNYWTTPTRLIVSASLVAASIAILFIGGSLLRRRSS